MSRLPTIVMSAIIALAPAAAMAETPRELLTTAAFQTQSKSAALALVDQAIKASEKILSTRPGDHEAILQQGVAIGYRAKLTRNRGDAKASLAIFQRLAAKDPRDAEAQLALAGWHLDAIDQLGGFLAQTVLGAKAQAGEAALGRAVALGGDRAFYPGVAAMMLIRKNRDNVAQARLWAELAMKAQTPTPLDALMKRAATAIAPALRANDGKAAAGIARKLLPFGKLAE
ncbi:MAG: hypothetical protein ABW184_17355 [Sphingobium sp.]